MEKFFLRLSSKGKEPQEFLLEPHSLATSITDVANTTSSYVFCDLEYSGDLVCEEPEDVLDLQVYINGNLVNTRFCSENGSIIFDDFSFGQRIFTECYGFVQFLLRFNIHGESVELETKYIQVMVRKGKQNDAVRRMAQYIYRHNELLLYGDKMYARDASGLKENGFKTLESRLILLKKISILFEEKYRYFHVNSRFNIIPHEHVDDFEKLRYITGNSIQYIIQHPEELQKISGNKGIHIGKFTYQPNKTLITNNIKSFDIYENRCIIGFLKFIIQETMRIDMELKEIISHIPNKLKEKENYIASSYFIYASTREALSQAIRDIEELQEKFKTIYSRYRKILPVKEILIKQVPKSTHIFLSIPEYRQIYEGMISWFKLGAFTLDSQKYMLSYNKISILYEAYVLIKILNAFNGWGYQLVLTDRITYTFSRKTYYQNTICKNFFVFERDNSRITIYYQPVIYNTDKSNLSGIRLYRNTSISFPKYLGDLKEGYYYSPDFLLKYESASSKNSKYLIADAKFSTIKNVKEYQVVPLVYKYLFSISTLDKEDEIVGLCIINGQSDEKKDVITDIYDYSENPTEINPNAMILTLTENEESPVENHEKLLKNIFEEYIF